MPYKSELQESQRFTSLFRNSLRTVNEVTETKPAKSSQVKTPIVANRYNSEIGSSSPKHMDHATVTRNQFVEETINMNKLIKWYGLSFQPNEHVIRPV